MWRDTFGINGSFGAPKIKIIINFSKSMTKFCLGLHYNADKSYLFENEKLVKKIKHFPSQFCIGSM